jgi:UDP-N-acetylmuramoylalanine--D-glutamate ligase
MTNDLFETGLSRLAGLKVLLVGLAREGQAAAKFLAAQGAIVSITDAKPQQQLTDQLAELGGLGITFHLGGHPDDLLESGQLDLLVVSPGVPINIPFLQRARALNLPLTTETRLFCQYCPSPVIAISGSSGKTTTTTLVGLMLTESGYTSHVGGNIGRPLIGELGNIAPQDRAVTELSSFQLEYFHASPITAGRAKPVIRPLLAGWSPMVGALLNITPNHLDRHDTMDAYIRAKRSMVQAMGPEQVAVLGLDNAETRAIGHGLKADVRWFSLRETVKRGACLINGQIALVDHDQVTPICPVEAIMLRGEHNVYNVLAACAIAKAAGASPAAMAAVAATFTGVPHRLELVATQAGVAYYNDSIATSPERLIAALKAFDQPLILLAGGKDKQLPWDEAARLIRQRAKHVILFGHAAALIEGAIEQVNTAGAATPVHRHEALEGAVAQARRLARPGDVVILSPGCASFDAYPDFVARGDHFRSLILDF